MLSQPGQPSFRRGCPSKLILLFHFPAGADRNQEANDETRRMRGYESAIQAF